MFFLKGTAIQNMESDKKQFKTICLGQINFQIISMDIQRSHDLIFYSPVKPKPHLDIHACFPISVFLFSSINISGREINV